MELKNPDVAAVETTVSETLLFLFRLAGRLYALPPEVVDLVAGVTSPLVVPTAPPIVRGIVHLRGRILTVIDLAAALGVDHAGAAAAGVKGDPPDARDQRMIVVSTPDVTLAFVADATLGIQPVRSEAVTRDPTGDRGVVGRIDDGALIASVLGPDVLVAGLRAAVNPNAGGEA